MSQRVRLSEAADRLKRIRREKELLMVSSSSRRTGSGDVSGLSKTFMDSGELTGADKKA